MYFNDITIPRCNYDNFSLKLYDKRFTLYLIRILKPKVENKTGSETEHNKF